MLNGLFRRTRKESAKSAPPKGPPGKRCYVIGDIHGCADELSALLQEIRSDIEARPKKPTAIVSLGDLIDRGPNSRGVIECLMSLNIAGASIHVIAGNHEEMLLTGVKEDPSVLPGWLRHGGYSFCESYGINAEVLMGADDETIRTMILRAVPDEHIRFLENLVERVRFGDYLLVHAGINPEHSLDMQHPRDLRWIRDGFLNSNKNFGVVVVHGHTVSEEVEFHHNRIGVDTGAYRTGRLSAIRLEDDERSVISVG